MYLGNISIKVLLYYKVMLNHLQICHSLQLMDPGKFVLLDKKD